jgi:hypothetical protein
MNVNKATLFLQNANSMEQSPYLEADSCSADQENPLLSLNPTKFEIFASKIGYLSGTILKPFQIEQGGNK